MNHLDCNLRGRFYDLYTGDFNHRRRTVEDRLFTYFIPCGFQQKNIVETPRRGVSIEHYVCSIYAMIGRTIEGFCFITNSIRYDLFDIGEHDPPRNYPPIPDYLNAFLLDMV